MSHNINFNSRTGIRYGINLCRRAVEGTIGGAGKSVTIRQPNYPYYIETKDAFSIIQSIKGGDPVEQQSVDMMKDATDSMNKIAKDGRTAMCIMTDEIVQTTDKFELDPSKVEKEINELLPIIESEIDNQTKKITVDDVESVATTASNSERIGKLVAQVYKTQGIDCAVDHIEGSGTLEDYITYHDGVRFKGTGFLAESFVHDEETRKSGRKETKAIYEKPTILVTKRKILSIQDIDPLLQSLQQQGKKDLIIFTDDMDSGVATMLVDTHKAGIFNICIIKAPVLWKQYVFEDFAKCVGATIVEDATGITFKNLALPHLGTCDRIVIDKEETVITGTADITDHIAELRSRGDNDSLLRVHWLNAKGATIKIGATNEGELSNLRLATQDAVYSSEAALHYGVVAGGGVALRNIAKNINNPVLKDALNAPFNQIVKNYSEKESFDVSGNEGLNAKTGEVVDMFEAGIVDSALVVKNSVRNAIKIASIALRTDKLIDIPKPTLEEVQIELLLSKRNPF